MPTINDLNNPEFLELAATELRKEAERIQAAAVRLRETPNAEIGSIDPEVSIPDICPVFAGMCIFCGVC